MTQGIIIYGLKTKDSKLLAIACLYRSSNTTVSNSDNLNVLLKHISDKCKGNLIVLSDFTYPKIDWVHYSTNSSINNSNYKFPETTMDCFFQQYEKSSTRVRNSDNPFLLDLVMSHDDDDLIDNVSLLPRLGKIDHSTVEVLVKVFIK